MTSSDRFPEGAVAVALIGQKVDTMMEGVVRIEGKVDELDKKLDRKVGELDKKLDTKIGELDRRFDDKIKDMDRELGAQEKLSVGHKLSIKSLRYDVNEAKKKLDDVPKNISGAVSIHEKACPSREATITKLSKPSRPPKDTPKEIKRPSANGSIDVVKWLFYGAALIGIGIAAFLYFYQKLSGGVP